MSSTASQVEFPAARRQEPLRLRVVGCGNAFASDDSAGLEIVRRLREQGVSGCELLAMPQAGVDLLAALEGADEVLFVDAVESGAPPGTIHLVPLPSPELSPRALGGLSSHGWGLNEVLRLTQALERPAPRMILLGIELATVEPGALRSEEVERAIKLVVDRFPELCERLTAASGEACYPRRFRPGDDSFPGGS